LAFVFLSRVLRANTWWIFIEGLIFRELIFNFKCDAGDLVLLGAVFRRRLKNCLSPSMGFGAPTEHRLTLHSRGGLLDRHWKFGAEGGDH